jgi:hypothetical protein
MNEVPENLSSRLDMPSCDSLFSCLRHVQPVPWGPTARDNEPKDMSRGPTNVFLFLLRMGPRSFGSVSCLHLFIIHLDSSGRASLEIYLPDGTESRPMDDEKRK